MVQFECPRHWKPPVFIFGVGRIPFSHYWPSGVIRNGSLFPWPLRGNKEMAPQYEGLKGAKIWEQKWLNGLQIVRFECTSGWNPSFSFSFEVG